MSEASKAENSGPDMSMTSKCCQDSNRAANKFVDETQHVALNADTEDAETIIRNMRFMAYGIGFDDGALALLEWARRLAVANDGSEFPRMVVDIADLEAYFSEESK